jgi:hypothetical protein
LIRPQRQVRLRSWGRRTEPLSHARVLVLISTLALIASPETKCRSKRSQLCTQVAHPTRFERVTFAFGAR